MQRYRGRLVVVGAVLGLLLTACTGAASQGGSSSPSAAQVFTYDTYTPVMIDGWDPATEYSNGIIAMSNMYETLTRYNAVTHQVDPLLATSWSHSSDDLTWTFQLRRNVYFHTGRLMTAQAARASILRTMKLNGGAAYIWGAVTSIDTPDPATLVFHLKYPSPLDLEASADYSAYIYDTQAGGSEGLTKWLNTPHDAGTGPYTLQTWNKGQEFEVVLKAYPKYWGGWNGSHYSRVVFRVVPQDTTAAQLLQSGQVDFVEQMNPSLWSSFKTNPNVHLVTAASWQNLLGQLNCASGPLANATVREAISHAVDYNGIIAALKGAAAPSSGVVPPGLLGHFDNLPNYSYDLSKAAQLLKQAGYGPGGKPMNLTLTYTQGDTNEQIVATIMKSDLAKLNVNLSVQPLAWPTQWAKAKSSSAAQRQDIFIEYWWPDYADPFSWFINLFETEKQPFFNLSYYSNPTLDGMINKIESLVATNPSLAEQMYREMQVILLHDAPALFIYNANYQYAMLKTFSGFQVNPAYPNVIFVYKLKPLAR